MSVRGASSRTVFLLSIPFAALLWVPFYNRALPSLFGLPFFYWYQFVWIPITAFLVWIVFRRTYRREDD